MDLTPEQLSGKPRRIGTLNGKGVMHARTKGGLHLIVANKNGKPRTIAAAPHVAIARTIAEKHEPDVVWSDLNKGDFIDPLHYEFLLPKYEAMTAEFQRLEDANLHREEK